MARHFRSSLRVQWVTEISADPVTPRAGVAVMRLLLLLLRVMEVRMMMMMMMLLVLMMRGEVPIRMREGTPRHPL